MIGKQFVAIAVRGPLGVCFAIVGMLAIGVGSSFADDDDIVNAGGFELPFTAVFGGPGQLEGQVNPAGEGQIIPPGQWQRTPGGTSTAVVQSTVFAPGGGVQAVRVNRAANNDVRWAVQVDHLGYPDYPNPFPPEPAQPCICVNWDMRVEQTQGGAGTFGPFFGVEAYGDASGIGLLGSLGVDASTGDVLAQDPTLGGALVETGSVIGFGQWNHFQIKLDYSTDQFTVYRNFASLGTFGFVDGAGLDQFSDADISALAAAGDPGSQALTGTAYYDNFLVREGACTAGLSGDFNSDGSVDAADYVFWRKNFSSDQGKYFAWRANFGASLGPGSGAAHPRANQLSAAVPEPATLVLGMFAVVIWCHYYRRIPYKVYQQLVNE